MVACRRGTKKKMCVCRCVCVSHFLCSELNVSAGIDVACDCRLEKCRTYLFQIVIWRKLICITEPWDNQGVLPAEALSSAV